MFKPGDKVTYITPYECKKGIVKSIADENNTFVVYSCDGFWNKYYNYTAERTPNAQLKMGWDHTVEKRDMR